MKHNLLSASQVAQRLGVKPQTVYAYVSRGLLSSKPDANGRSQFDAAQVDALARRGRPRERARLGGVDVSIGTGITEIRPEALSYRGHDAIALSRSHSFEAVAQLLWTGQLATTRWTELDQPHPIVRRTAALIPDNCFGVERFAAVAAALAPTQPLRIDLSQDNVVALARSLLASFVCSLPALSSRPGSLAQRLWPRLSPLPTSGARVRALNAALVLLADHELATSTFAARVAASTRADPVAVVLAGLGALAGPLHGKAARSLHRLLVEAANEANAAACALANGSTVTGFGHPVYRQGDPRAKELLSVLEPLLKARTRSVIAAVADAGRRKTGAEPNIDFALAALAYAMEMPVGASEAIFAIARTAGLIAHGLEEYGEQPLRFRARALYTG
jgi:citrate synthase